jgi:hypothetical protein
VIWINLKSILGAPKAKNNAVQLVSNRHTVFENFQYQAMRKAYQQKNWSHPFLIALTHPEPQIPFSYDFLISNATAESASRAKNIDKIIEKNVPSKLVSDPSVEVGNLAEANSIEQSIIHEKGQKAADAVTEAIAGQMRQFSMNIRSFMEAVLLEKDK